jgi:uncharacterized protein (TIGR00369 family)
MDFDTATLRQTMPLAEVLGAELVRADKDEVVLRMAWREDLCTSAGMLHGGALMALADTSGALCAFLNLPPGANTSTIESKTNFFRACRAGHVQARSTPLHAGRTTVVVETDLTDDAGKRLARVTQTQAVLHPQGQAQGQ